MTSYQIMVGYNYDNPNYGELWEKLKAIVAELREETGVLMAEAKRMVAPDDDGEGSTLEDYARWYRSGGPPGNVTLTIQESDSKPGDSYHYVYQVSSGGEPGRSMKAHLRRAFCRLAMERAHAQGIEISIVVS